MIVIALVVLALAVTATAGAAAWQQHEGRVTYDDGPCATRVDTPEGNTVCYLGPESYVGPEASDD